VTRNWRRVAGRLAAELPRPSTTPFTFWYLALLLASTIVIRAVSPQTAQEILSWSSTSSANLHRHLFRVLIASALWVDGRYWWYVVLFSLVFAPVERRIGARWTIAVFASAHVLATLASELPIGWQVRHHLLPRAMAHLSDFGVSYGFFGVLGIAILMLRGWWRWTALVLAEAAVVLPWFAASDGPTADPSLIGHPLSLHIGLLGWLPWAVRHHLLGVLRLDAPPPTRATRPVNPVAAGQMAETERGE
jgi:hypothetical protein